MTTLDEIQARADAATEGPWTYGGMAGIRYPSSPYYVFTDEETEVLTNDDGGMRKPDAVFIAHAREDVPKLIAALRAVEAVHTKICLTSNAGGCRHGENCDLSYCGSCGLTWPCPTVHAIQKARG